MARKHRILLHIGPNPATAGLQAGIDEHQRLLEGADLIVAPVEQRDLDLAVHEMVRTHKAAGLRRRDVEGSWARTCRALLKAKRDLVLAVPGFHAADDAQVALILDGLRGLEVHAVVTPDPDGPDADEPDDLVAAWRAHLTAAQVHVAPLAEDADPVDLAEELVGLGLCLEQQELDRRITKLKKRRKSVRARLALREAS